jgi:hypothetical protein
MKNKKEKVITQVEIKSLTTILFPNFGTFPKHMSINHTNYKPMSTLIPKHMHI